MILRNFPAFPLPTVLVLSTVLVLWALVVTGPTMASTVPGPFELTPGELQRLSLDRPDIGAGVTVLWRDDAYRFDADGRLTYTRHWIYRIDDAAALETWSSSEARWSPWHQAAPTVRARVLTADGTVHRLGGDSLRGSLPDELPSPSGPLADQRLVLRMPLPSLAVDAVVEEEVVVRDTEPLFAGGTVYRHPLVLPVPIYRGQVVLEAPKALPLRFAVRRMPGLEPTRTLDGERVTLTFTYGDQPPAALTEPWQPPDRPRYPHIAFSTGKSWDSVGAAYSSRLEAALRTPSPPPTVVPNLEDPLAMVAEILAELRQGVRPVDRILGAAPLTPTRPADIIARAAGDSQDFSTLLVARLRAAGIPAYVALLDAGHGQDVETHLPGLGLFTRAVVYVPVGRAIWVDPSDPWSRAGELPSESRGRWALILSPTVRQLIRTPEANSSHNLSRFIVDVHLSEQGPARVLESGEYHGDVERSQRRLAATLNPADRRRAYLDYGRSVYRAQELGEITETATRDLSQTYRLGLEFSEAEHGDTFGNGATFTLSPHTLFIGLPPELLLESTSPRQNPFVFRLPFIAERHYRIHAPEGLVPQPLPSDRVLSLGPGLFEQRSYEQGGVVHMVLRLDTGPTEITAEQFTAYQKAIQDLLAEGSTVLRWGDTLFD